jgi:poly(A) polymerase/tRNA nucleotidyltransferase (CCA-adding enzyme)
MDELGLAPGPEVGRLLEELREAAFAGEVRSKEEAMARARDASTKA